MESIIIAHIYVNYALRTKQTKIPLSILTFEYFKTNKCCCYEIISIQTNLYTYLFIKLILNPLRCEDI